MAADGAAMETVVIDPTRALRYVELFLVGEEWISVLNSMGLSEGPADLWEAIEAETAAVQLEAAMVIKNGPHWWMADRSTLRYSAEQTTVGGIDFRFVARLPAALAKTGKLVPPFYTVVEAQKQGELLYLAGRPVYELVAPDGGVFVLQSTSVEPSELEMLGQRLSLPEGWQYRIRELEDDLAVSLDGTVEVVMDDLHNVYNR
jgi:hypothetical protein